MPGPFVQFWTNFRARLFYWGAKQVLNSTNNFQNIYKTEPKSEVVIPFLTDD